MLAPQAVALLVLALYVAPRFRHGGLDALDGLGELPGLQLHGQVPDDLPAVRHLELGHLGGSIGTPVGLHGDVLLRGGFGTPVLHPAAGLGGRSRRGRRGHRRAGGFVASVACAAAAPQQAEGHGQGNGGNQPQQPFNILALHGKTSFFLQTVSSTLIVSVYPGILAEGPNISAPPPGFESGGSSGLPGNGPAGPPSPADPAGQNPGSRL